MFLVYKAVKNSQNKRRAEDDYARNPTASGPTIRYDKRGNPIEPSTAEKKYWKKKVQEREMQVSEREPGGVALKQPDSKPMALNSNPDQHM
ncbi:hypothetical protein P7C73_g246, partial [Tremellales sp. Uapishka_1]